MNDIVFMDTETLGLQADAPVWEFAAVRRPHGDDLLVDPTDALVFTIRHDPAGWLDDLPESFLRDYQSRYDEDTALCGVVAAHQIHRIVTENAIVVGSNPDFDMRRIEKLLLRYDLTPRWHYHPIDMPSVVQGFLAACGRLFPQPWKSDALSRALGVEPGDFDRHTAMGDVQWVMAQWDVVMGGAS